MNKRILALTILTLFTSACSLYRISSEDATTTYYPSKPASEVIYLENIDMPHEIIGTVTVNTERRQRLDEVIEKMKHEAGILGGDAITNIRSDATGQWKQLPAQQIIGNAHVRANFTASVVVLK